MRRSRSRAGGTEQLGDGCQSGPWHHLCSETTQACSHTPASYLPLELFTPGSVCFSPTTTSLHLFVANYCTIIPLHLLISYEQQHPCVLSFNPNPSSTANQDTIDKDKKKKKKQLTKVCLCIPVCVSVCTIRLFLCWGLVITFEILTCWIYWFTTLQLQSIQNYATMPLVETSVIILRASYYTVAGGSFCQEKVQHGREILWYVEIL